jgi:hypothetical protein
MTASALPPPDAWVPVPMCWRNVQAGDVVLDPDGSLWMVEVSGERPDRRGVWTAVRHGDQTRARQRDPEEVVNVLVPLAAVLAEYVASAPAGEEP